MPPSVVGCLAGWMIMISLSNTPSFSLSLHFPIQTHHRKKSAQSLAPLTITIQQINIACSFHAILERTSSFCNTAFITCGCRLPSRTLLSIHSSHPTPSRNSTLLDTQTTINHLLSALLELALCAKLKTVSFGTPVWYSPTFCVYLSLMSAWLRSAGDALDQAHRLRAALLTIITHHGWLLVTILSFASSQPYCPSNSLAHQPGWL
jgi:hypothetical protein